MHFKICFNENVFSRNFFCTKRNIEKAKIMLE